MIILYNTFITIITALFLYTIFLRLTHREKEYRSLFAIIGLISYSILTIAGQKPLKELVGILEHAAISHRNVFLYLTKYHFIIASVTLALFVLSRVMSDKLIVNPVDLFIRISMQVFFVSIASLLLFGVVSYILTSQLPYPDITRGGY